MGSPRRLLSIDPSFSGSGWAYFKDCELYDCGCVGTKPVVPPYERITALIRVLRTKPHINPTALAIEWPQVYSISARRGDANDLLKLAAVAGAVCATYPDVPATLALPAAWKGQVPKVIHNHRVLSRMTEAEAKIFNAHKFKTGEAHNVIDAIGLGLWCLGRLDACNTRQGQDDPRSIP